MFTLSAKADKRELHKYLNSVCMLGATRVRISTHVENTKSGSWGCGFKFHETTYFILVKDLGKMYPSYSFDYGKTWSTSKITAFQSAGRAKIVLQRNTTKEFAYDSIQNLNRQYYG